jgi:hypothetical protein
MFRKVRKGSVLSRMLLNMVMEEMIKVKEGQESELPKFMVYADDSYMGIK